MNAAEHARQPGLEVENPYPRGTKRDAMHSCFGALELREECGGSLVAEISAGCLGVFRDDAWDVGHFRASAKQKQLCGKALGVIVMATSG